MPKIQKMTFEMHMEDDELKVRAEFEPGITKPESSEFQDLTEEERLLQRYAHLIFKSVVKTLRETEQEIEGSLH